MYLADNKWFENLREFSRTEEIGGYKDFYNYGEFYFVNNYAVTYNLFNHGYLIECINNRDKRFLVKVLNTATGKIKTLTVIEWHEFLLKEQQNGIISNMAVSEEEHLYLTFKNTKFNERELIQTPNICFYVIGKNIYFWIKNKIKKVTTYKYDFFRLFRSFCCYGCSIKFDADKYIDFQYSFEPYYEVLLYDNVPKKDFIDKANSGMFDIIDKMTK